MGVPRSPFAAMVPLRLFSCLVLVLTIPSFTGAAPTQQAVSDFIASEVEYIQDFFDSISAFFLGDSAQQAEREAEEEDEYYDDDEDYREEDEGAVSRSGVVFVPHVEDGRAELRSSTKSIQI